MKAKIKGVRIFTADGKSETVDIEIENGLVKNITPSNSKDTLIAIPSLVDIHAHSRYPGQTHKEIPDKFVGSAIKGGYSAVLCMANTDPVVDSPDVLVDVMKTFSKFRPFSFFQASAITKGLKGREIVDIEKMAKAGAKAISDDGKDTPDTSILVKAVKTASKVGIPVIIHPEVDEVSNSGVFDESIADAFSTKPILKEAEVLSVIRGFNVSMWTGEPVHLTHISLAESLEVLAKAKEKGVKLSADATPHHITLSSDCVKLSPQTFRKMNPPLRKRKDVEALQKAIANRTINIIATDHAPHSESEKNKPIESAPFGTVGFETSLPAIFTLLVLKGIISMKRLIEVMSLNPAYFLGISPPQVSQEDSFVVFDPNAKWKVDESTLVSTSPASAFYGMELWGKILLTVIKGKVLYAEKNIN